MYLHSVKDNEKQMESTADGALDPWSCFYTAFIWLQSHPIILGHLANIVNFYVLIDVQTQFI